MPLSKRSLSIDIMSGFGQYQGSQAFALNAPDEQESINPNTGSLNFRLPLIELRGVRPSVDLNVQLFYAAGHRRTFGLPRNWGLNLPYVLDGKSLTTAQGASYIIDPHWSSSESTQSGLKYVNSRAIKFEQIPLPMKLPCGRPGTYRYILRNQDGSCDYFDAKGKPLEHRDIFGNWIYYAFAAGQDSDLDSNDGRLDHIEDSWGQKVTFQHYPGSEMTINLPDGGKVLIALDQNGITLVKDAVGRKTTFSYAPFEGSPVLTSIEHATGLKSLFEYTGIQYLDQRGDKGLFPAVRRHLFKERSMDGTTDSIIRRTDYQYGVDSYNTFTGATIRVKMGGPVDTLMHSNGVTKNYTYVP
jgi:hypothetical protein